MKKSKKKIKRIDRNTLQTIINAPHLRSYVTEEQGAEMAIPSYLNKNPFIRALFWNRYDLIYQLATLESGMTVCEFGCGIGVFLPTLAPEVAKVYAVDIFPQYAREMARIYDLEIAFSEDIDGIPNESLDLVIASEVLEHLLDPGAYVRLFAQKLKPGGRLLMSGPTESTIYKLGRSLAWRHKYHDYHPHNVYELHEIITQNGYKTILQKPYPWKITPLYMVNLYSIG